MTDHQPSAAQLYSAFVSQSVSREQVARMKPDRAVQMVTYRRKKKVAQELRELPLSDQQITDMIQSYARGEIRRDIESLDERDLLADILDAQHQILQVGERQARHLQTISTAAQIWLILTALGLLAGCLLFLLGGAGLPGL